MSKTEEYQLRPHGWENDPEEERIRFSSLDYLAASTYNSYALFFKLDDDEKSKAVEVLKEGLSKTLAQCRQLVGIIEKNPDNDDHSFVKKRDTSIKLIVKTFDANDDFPSFQDIEKAHFASSCLGDVSRLVVEGMSYEEKPESLTSARPAISAYQANLIPGGLIFVTNFHHYANDVMGWANFVYQLAENCHAVANHTAPPPWDPANLDATRFTALDFPSASKVDGPSPPGRHPLLRAHSSLLFHLPKSKAASLKTLASPEDGSWISTYDAFTAILWRTLTKHRAALYAVSEPTTTTPLFGEAHNLFWAAVSATHPSPAPLTVQEIISSAPLTKLASYIRSLTNSIDQAGLDAALAMLAPVRDKTSLFTRVNSFPPLSLLTTDWRDAKVCERADFGFVGGGKPRAFRHFFGDVVTEGLVLIYPPRRVADDTDEGCEFVIAVETEIVDAVLEDEEFGKWFEFRGYE
ncbi:hypothetical protein B0H63DRAFT_402672 [Podospora didyma]|uniref:Trichothecene 3-O-acetyltransferase-like N-terminal domain-containing protein n=1 Tax=Podospora didyma TaxID=330526 RepID=A0AAE0K6I5_9PEZI|nr:hypothetical protein B0H63DRAFT_402672 [Podospora didyma]